MNTLLIVGLGNPGPTYQWTRHNAGFMVLDRFSDVTGIPVTKKSFSGFSGDGIWQGRRLVLLKPQTFMNLSGRSVAEAIRFFKIHPHDVIVVHDELDIPYGQIRLKKGGGHGGHNGLRSIVAELGTGDFTRLRVGVGRPTHGDVSGHVLSPFRKEENEWLPHVVDAGADALTMLLHEGLPKAMSLCNSRKIIG